LGEVQAFLTVSGIEVQLSTTGLIRREDHLVAQSFEYLDDGSRGIGKETVIDAGNEEGNFHVASLP
jgi:hypothetical protein